MLLQSLRQLITLKANESSAKGGTGDSMGGHLQTVMDLLIGQCDADDEGVRSMVAECLGRLALIAPAHVLPALKALLTNQAPETRATVVYSLKFTITDQAPMKELSACITDFLLLIKDSEIMVRRAALTTLNSATHNKPSLIRPVLHSDWLLPALYGETVYKQELVRTVNLGPFQHKVDDGAELRKLSLACMDTLFDKCADKLETSTFLLHLQDRLSDELDDMKQAAYQLLCKLAVREPFFVREVRPLPHILHVCLGLQNTCEMVLELKATVSGCW
jgi:cullin-associated NEDD8-dissociated protein 1